MYSYYTYKCLIFKRWTAAKMKNIHIQNYPPWPAGGGSAQEKSILVNYFVNQISKFLSVSNLLCTSRKIAINCSNLFQI